MTDKEARDQIDSFLKHFPNTFSNDLEKAFIHFIKVLEEREQESYETSTTDEPMTMVYPTIFCDYAISLEDALKVASKECQEWRGIYGRIEDGMKKLPPVTPKPTEYENAISRILKRMWNCRGEHTTSIDKVKMEQIIRNELHSVTPNSHSELVDAPYVTKDEMQECRDIVKKYQPKGHWIDIEIKNLDDGYRISKCRCSECYKLEVKVANEPGDFEHFKESRFCPNCGIEMENKE